MHRRAALGSEARPFDSEILDQHDGIARAERLAVAVFMRGFGRDVVGPRLVFRVEVKLVEQIARPVGIEALERARGEDLEGGVVGPHGGGEDAEVVGRCVRVCAERADFERSVRGAAGDGGFDEGGVFGGAEGAGHGGCVCA